MRDEVTISFTRAGVQYLGGNLTSWLLALGLETNPFSGSVSMDDTDSAHPNSADLQALEYQVGGHKGIQVTGDGALIVKAALPLELQFYQNMLAQPALASLRRWVPTYLGTLRLEGQNTAEGLASVEVPENEKELIVIENAAHGFRKPNIIDIKLGTVLYDDDAGPEKKERMQKKAKQTTSGEAGVCLTGFQVNANVVTQPEWLA